MSFKSVLTLAIFVLSGCAVVVQKFDLKWHMLTADSLDYSHFDKFPAIFLGVVRLVFAWIIWTVLLHVILDHSTFEVRTVSALGHQRIVLMRGYERLTMFTVWAWIVQGLYFSLAAYCSIQRGIQEVNGLHYILPPMNSTLQRLTWILFEVSFPVAFMISWTVSFVLIPGHRRLGYSTTSFFTLNALLMHNCNVWFMAFEFIINRLSFCFLHVVFVLMFGFAYVLFAWVWYNIRGIFHYYFLDYNHAYSFYWYLCLVIGICSIFTTGLGCSQLQNQSMHSVASMVIVLFSSFLSVLFDDGCFPFLLCSRWCCC
jgi:hypothetical protein